MEMFPEEAGTLDPRKRIIPFLPGMLDLQHSGVIITLSLLPHLPPDTIFFQNSSSLERKAPNIVLSILNMEIHIGLDKQTFSE